MKPTAIQWTNYSTNPVVFHDGEGKKHWHCEKVSAGCANCYAEALEKRFGGDGAGFVAKNTPDRHASLDEAELRRILRFKVKDGKNKVFPFDMTDVFAPWVTDAMLDRLFAVFALRPDLVFQVLTKRPERARKYLQSDVGVPDAICDAINAIPISKEQAAEMEPIFWPLPNVWLGTSVEDQSQAIRILELLDAEAAVKFLSCEPLLGPLDLENVDYIELMERYRTGDDLRHPYFPRIFYDVLRGHLKGPDDIGLPRIDWVIVGGESGPGARPMDLAWARSLRDQCAAAGVAFFMKQLGAKPFDGYQPFYNVHEGGPDEEPRRLKLKDRHGGNWDEWPADLKVREFPGGAA